MKYFYSSMLVLAFSLGQFDVQAQERIPRSSSEIQLAIEKLGVTGRVLYVAAHPDDENTRLISWLANDQKMETAYLSLTRGDGGQNLIGTEKGQYMGLIRTQELMEARKVDGGKQFFTRAVDFGYSKSSKETLKKWNRDQVLEDVVWVIRKYRPDVIVTRFPPTHYAGHGHHSASAILAEEAFDLAADKKAYPNQLEYVDTWQPTRLYFNASTWWNKNLDSIADASDEYIAADVGTFNPYIGKWHTEIAAESRSMHKSQGFGAAKRKGQQIEYLKYVKGKKAKATLFDEVVTDWSRVENGSRIENVVQQLRATYQPSDPSRSISQLLELLELLHVSTNFYAKAKIPEVKLIIEACLGLNLEALAEKGEVCRGQEVKLSFQLLNQSNIQVTSKKIEVEEESIRINKTIASNIPISAERSLKIAEDFPLTQPYWLKEDYATMFQVSEQNLIGLPENKPALSVIFTLEIEGTEVQFTKPVVHKWTDRVEGEKVKPLSITPRTVINFDQNSYIFNAQESKNIKVIVKSYQSKTAGVLKLQVPKEWIVQPTLHEVQFDKAGDVKTFTFRVEGSKATATGELLATYEDNGQVTSYSEKIIDYPHIQQQYVFPTSSVPVSHLNIQTSVNRVAYIMGAGDDIPKSLEQIGMVVDLIPSASIPSTNLSEYRAVVLGIRAINTEKAVAEHFNLLLDYVNQGGNLVVQYNTNRRLPVEQPGPYPISLSRDRVTVEEAPAKILTPAHAIFNFPNRITETDFDNWVQERGLYFANEWDDNYTAHISWNDPEENEKKGGLLTAYYGKGTFVFTGISFFRQLPAGVPGAYRLFTNIINFNQGR